MDYNCTDETSMIILVITKKPKDFTWNLILQIKRNQLLPSLTERSKTFGETRTSIQGFVKTTTNFRRFRTIKTSTRGAIFIIFSWIVFPKYRGVTSAPGWRIQALSYQKNEFRKLNLIIDKILGLPGVSRIVNIEKTYESRAQYQASGSSFSKDKKCQNLMNETLAIHGTGTILRFWKVFKIDSFDVFWRNSSWKTDCFQKSVWNKGVSLLLHWQ